MRCLLIAFFAVLAACTAQPRQADNGEQINIIRDNFGVPHIYADTVYGLYYGYGYAVAQDRLFQMEMAKRSTQGRVAEVLGADYLDYDKTTRQLFDPGSIQKQLAALPQKDLDVFQGYAAGLNAWLDEITAQPDTLTPKQFIDLGFTPSRWTAYDVVMIFVGTMNNRYGDFNSELENSRILDALIKQHGEAKGTALFDLLNPRFTDDAPTTIPREDWSRPVPDVLQTSAVNRQVPAGLGAFDPSAITSGASNCYILGKDKTLGANAILVNGPQFGWYNPAYTYSAGLHGPGIDVVGNTPFAYPMIMFGHNKTITWGSTWGVSDIVDLYEERLNPDDDRQYWYKGEYRAMEQRIERIAVRGADTLEFPVMRSVHGPIIHHDAEAGVAYAKHRAWDGIELETLLSWLYATWASDYPQWKAEAAKSAINVNMYFADVDGNIGYFHGGHFPRRVAGHDNRFPARGDGSMDWLGRLSVDIANPHVVNPASGYLANWNNKPAQGVASPDFFFYNWTSTDRVDILHRALSAQQGFSAEQAWALLENSSYADINAEYFLPLIEQATADQPAGTIARQANSALQTWDRMSRDADEDGYYDEAGTAIFQTFLAVLSEQVLKDDLGAAYPYFAGTGYPSASKASNSGTNTPPGIKSIAEALSAAQAFDLLNGETPGEMIRSALTEAIRQLQSSQPDTGIDKLRLKVAPRPFAHKNFLGIPQAGANEAMQAPIEQNRGTENNMVVMKPDAIVGYEVTPPGQNAFISPDGKTGTHYDDQFEMYYRFGKKRMWFYPQDVQANKRSEVKLAVKRCCSTHSIDQVQN